MIKRTVSKEICSVLRKHRIKLAKLNRIEAAREAGTLKIINPAIARKVAAAGVIALVLVGSPREAAIKLAQCPVLRGYRYTTLEPDLGQPALL